ncbi:LOW QUALITY PROTEIN: riboflavin biosynthesis [Geomicrobium sp. JCM 19039]|nr:LOW QUALITY PROTEIN: riboflavin biosynthesis [Geomicrobium sp. JCM 19039]
MLVKYKSAFKKIAMGLLSYMPDLKDIKTLTETIHRYEEDEKSKLYLWKKDDDFVGVIGFTEQADGTRLLEHVCVNPSFVSEGIGVKMVCTLEDRLDAKFIGNESTEPFLNNCQSHRTNLET